MFQNTDKDTKRQRRQRRCSAVFSFNLEHISRFLSSDSVLHLEHVFVCWKYINVFLKIH